MYLLGYDIGSSSVKASLVEAATGTCVGSTFYPKSEACMFNGTFVTYLRKHFNKGRRLFVGQAVV